MLWLRRYFLGLWFVSFEAFSQSCDKRLSSFTTVVKEMDLRQTGLPRVFIL